MSVIRAVSLVLQFGSVQLHLTHFVTLTPLHTLRILILDGANQTLGQIDECWQRRLVGGVHTK